MPPLMLMMLIHLVSKMFGQPMAGPNPNASPLQGLLPWQQAGPGVQAAQGPAGAVAGHHGQMGPVRGGLPALLNAQGALPHQQPGYQPIGGAGASAVRPR